MSMQLRADFSEVAALADDLGAAALAVHPEIARAVEAASREGAAEARRRIRGQIRGKYLPHYPSAITHEASGLIGEFGPDASRLQGGMGRGVEYGSVNKGPLPHMGPAADMLERVMESRGVTLVAKVLW